MSFSQCAGNAIGGATAGGSAGGSAAQMSANDYAVPFGSHTISSEDRGLDSASFIRDPIVYDCTQRGCTQVLRHMGPLASYAPESIREFHTEEACIASCPMDSRNPSGTAPDPSGNYMRGTARDPCPVEVKIRQRLLSP